MTLLTVEKKSYALEGKDGTDKLFVVVLRHAEGTVVTVSSLGGGNKVTRWVHVDAGDGGGAAPCLGTDGQYRDELLEQHRTVLLGGDKDAWAELCDALLARRIRPLLGGRHSSLPMFLGRHAPDVADETSLSRILRALALPAIQETQ